MTSDRERSGLPGTLSPGLLGEILRLEPRHWRQIKAQLHRQNEEAWKKCEFGDEDFLSVLHTLLCDPARRSAYNAAARKVEKRNRKLELYAAIHAYYFKSIRSDSDLYAALPDPPSAEGVVELLADGDDMVRCIHVAWAFLEQGYVDEDFLEELLSSRPVLAARFNEAMASSRLGADPGVMAWQETGARLKRLADALQLDLPQASVAKQIQRAAQELNEIAAQHEQASNEFWTKFDGILEGVGDALDKHPQIQNLVTQTATGRDRRKLPHDTHEWLARIEQALQSLASCNVEESELFDSLKNAPIEHRSELLAKFQESTTRQQVAISQLIAVQAELPPFEGRDQNRQAGVSAWMADQSEHDAAPADDDEQEEQDAARQGGVSVESSCNSENESYDALESDADAPVDEKGEVIGKVTNPGQDPRIATDSGREEIDRRVSVEDPDTGNLPEGPPEDVTGLHASTGVETGPCPTEGIPRSDTSASTEAGPMSDVTAFLLEQAAQGRFARAFWIADFCEIPPIDPNILAALCEGQDLDPEAACPGHLSRCLSELAASVRSWDEDQLLMLAAGLLRPMLFLRPPPQAIYELVSEPKLFAPPLGELMTHLRDFRVYEGVPLGTELTGDGQENAHIDEQVLEAVAAAQAFLASVAHIGFSYPPAEKALQYLYAPGSAWYQLQLLVAKDHRKRVSEAEAIIKKLDPIDEIKSLHERSDLPELVNPLVGRARNKLSRHLHDTLTLAGRWCSLVKRLDADRAGDVQGADRIRVFMNGLHERVRKARAMLSSRPQDTASSVAAHVLDRIQRRLEGQRSDREAVGDACIQLIGVRLDDDLCPVHVDAVTLVQEFKALDEGRVKPEQVFDTCLERYEFIRAERILEKFSFGENFRARLEKRRDDRRQDLVKELADLQARVEDAFLLGQLRDSVSDIGETDTVVPARSELLAALTDASQLLASGSSSMNEGIGVAERLMHRVLEPIERLAASTRMQLEKEKNEVAARFPSSDQGQEDREHFEAAFNECLQRRDDVVAVDLLERAKRAQAYGEPMTRVTDGTSEQLQAFLRRADEYREQLAVHSRIRRLIESIKEGRSDVGIAFGQLDSGRREESVNALQAWGRLGGLKLLASMVRAEELVTEICRFMGFPVARAAKAGGTARDGMANFVIGLVPRSTSAPLPGFGSQLASRLDVVVCQSRREPEQVTEFLRQAKIQNRSVMVLLMQAESSTYRIKWQKECARSQVSALPLDLCLLVHLCGLRNRLPALFEIGLPFTWARPYITKGETVAREMFVGREQEVAELGDPTGGCIVFGGRQLGKSALLRHVLRENHDPNGERYIAYVDVDDLGNEPQTHEEMLSAFWRRVEEALSAAGAIDADGTGGGRRGRRSDELVPRCIADTLREHDGRRITLLLDETDDLLDCDSGRDFALVRRLRALMADTDRRFKIVFAGLQSVQRYNNWENHPFAQLGKEMVINPLPPPAAQELIVRPFRSLGFRFESPHLVIRILSLCNYHPGLIQIFCYRLLEKQYARWQRQDYQDPVRVVTSDDVLAVERDNTLQEDIRNRFDWTLDLDDRYKLITYALVLTADPGASRTEAQFMELGSSWWPSVFSVMDPQGLRALLEEMSGLGVLLAEQEDRIRKYRLRSPNLLRLLGPQEAIEAELTRIISLERPSRPNPRKFRTMIDKKACAFGPLSKEQEGRIADLSQPFLLSLVLGSSAMGLDSVRRQVTHLMRDVEPAEAGRLARSGWREIQWRGVASSTGPEHVIAELEDAFRGRNRNHRFMVLDFREFVHDGDLGELFEQILSDVGRHATREARGKLVILLGPGEIWSWMRSRSRPRLINKPRFTVMSTRRWSDGAIGNALDNIGLKTGSRVAGEKIYEASGGVHDIVSSVLSTAREIKGGNAREAVDIAMEICAKALSDEKHDVLLERLGLRVGGALQVALDTLLRLREEIDGRPCLTATGFELATEALSDEEAANELLMVEGTAFRDWLRAIDLVCPSRSPSAEFELCPWTARTLDTLGE